MGSGYARGVRARTGSGVRTPLRAHLVRNGGPGRRTNRAGGLHANGRRCAAPVAQPFLHKRLHAKGAPGGGRGEGSRANGRGCTPPFFVPPVTPKLWGHATGRGL